MRNAAPGIIVAISTLHGIIPPSVTGLIIQAVGRNVAVGFHSAHLLASIFLLLVAVVFLLCMRPDEQLDEESLLKFLFLVQKKRKDVSSEDVCDAV
jgi:TRAP-type mannitol/chloroaromatic compound transport system permease large subunit